QELRQRLFHPAFLVPAWCKRASVTSTEATAGACGAARRGARLLRWAAAPERSRLGLSPRPASRLRALSSRGPLEAPLGVGSSFSQKKADSLSASATGPTVPLRREWQEHRLG